MTRYNLTIETDDPTVIGHLANLSDILINANESKTMPVDVPNSVNWLCEQIATYMEGPFEWMDQTQDRIGILEHGNLIGQLAAWIERLRAINERNKAFVAGNPLILERDTP